MGRVIVVHGRHGQGFGLYGRRTEDGTEGSNAGEGQCVSELHGLLLFWEVLVLFSEAVFVVLNN